MAEPTKKEYKGFRQYLPEKEKTEDWAIACIEYICSHENGSSGDGHHRLNYNKLYRAYNGYLDESDYTYITRPTGSKQGKLPPDAKYPAKLRNYPIIKPIVDLLVGEKSKRFNSWQVVVSNPDSFNIYREDLNKKLLRVFQQRTINVLNQMGFDTGVESQQVPSPQEVVDQFKQDYKDERAIIGSDALEYIVLFNKIYDHFLTGFLDFIVVGEVSSFRGIKDDDLEYEIFPPSQISYEKSPSNKFIEDSNWVVRSWELTNSEVLDMFSSEIKNNEDTLKEIENPESANNTGSDKSYSITTYILSNGSIGEDTSGSPGASREHLITVEHCVWRAFRKRGIIQDIDEYGQPVTIEVDETYKGSDVLHWEWGSDIWHGYRINGNKYFKIERWPYQINKLTRSRKIPLPYNGRIYSDRNSSNQSVVNIGLAFQALFNVLKYKVEQLIAKNKDKVILMDYSAIPRTEGWDEFKFMYFVDAFGFMFIDRKKADKSFNQYAVLDAGLGSYIRDMITIMDSVKNDYEEVLGINRQRKGQFAASDSVGTSQYALGQSAVINEELFKKFEEFEERELQHLMDLSQYAWADGGKKAMFVASDRRQVMLDLDPIVYCNADYSVFVTNSAKENEKLKQIKGLVERIAQNPNTKNQQLAEIIDADNYSKLKEKLIEADNLQEQFEQKKHENTMAQIEAQNQAKAQEGQREDMNKELDRQNKIDVALIQAGSSIAGAENADKSDVERFRAILDAQLKRESNAIEREKIQAGREKAKLDAQTKLRNPVVGENKK